MHTAKLRKVGGSVMLAVPPALLETMRLAAGGEVGLSVKGRRLIVEPRVRPRFTLESLLKEEQSGATRRRRDRRWLADAPRGRELL